MSTPENGLPGNIIATLPAAVAITSSATDGAGHTNITTATAHGLTQGDYVDIQGHATNVAVNGRWAVFGVVSADVYAITLVSSVAGSGGASQSLAFSTTAALPADGVDLEDAASVNVPFEALFDRTAFLMLVTGGYSIVGSSTSQIDRDVGGDTAWKTVPNVLSPGTWAIIGNGNSVPLPFSTLPGDVMLVTAATTVGSVTTSGGATKARFGIGWWNSSSLGPTTAIVAKLPASAQYVYPTGSFPQPLSLFAAYPVTQTIPAGSSQTLFVFEPLDGTLTGCTLIGDCTVTTTLLRPTGKPQL